MTTDEIMALADAYAEHREFRGEERSEGHRATLRAAVEQLVRARDALKQGPYVGIEYYQAEVERAERAEQDAAALKQDAERYRWLRGGSDVPAHSVRWGRWEINHWEGANGWRNLLCGELDAAIDADKEKQ